MLDLINKYEAIIKDYKVLHFSQEKDLFRFVAEIMFIDDSKLVIRDYRFLSKERKYVYHWQNKNNKLIIRWDNAKHWKNIKTYPHHKHIERNTDILESYETSLNTVLNYIVKIINQR